MTSFRERIGRARDAKKSRIVLALDPPLNTPNLQEFAARTIKAVEQHVCAIKFNFHLILPLSGPEISHINKIAHSYGLQSIADIKLNDIEDTNEVTLGHLVARMGFDAVIANPFIGKGALASLVRKAHKQGGGIIALVYMSHPGAIEGFGLKVIEGNGKHVALYRMFFDRAAHAGADGIVVAATQLGVLGELAKQEMTVYSPGVGAQGGDAEMAVKSGADYLIIGRSIVEAEHPTKVAQEIQRKILSISK
jgi:orotidine-5'-phosphate decarboxylase